jgi:Tfp pilus assembly protein PilO
VNIEKIADILNKIPIMFLLVCLLAFFSYDYYNFINEPSSPLITKKAEIAAAKIVNAKLQVKVLELEKFAKQLEDKKVELRRLVEDFQRLGGALADRIDTPLFMKMVVTEAKKVGLRVESLKPKGSAEKDVYLETIFSFNYRGIFGQLLVFLQRLASTSEIIHIGDIEIKTSSSSSGRFVEIKGDLEIRTYTYLPGKAEAMVKQLLANSKSSVASVGSGGPLSAGNSTGNSITPIPAQSPVSSSAQQMQGKP